jgi:hypothetical protein
VLRLVKTIGRRKKTGPLLECQRCHGREVFETKIGVALIDGKPRGGTKVLCCAQCQRKGERVVLA